MKTLSVFEEDGSKIASVTMAGKTPLTFARSAMEWSTVARWIRQGFYVLDEASDDYVKVEPDDPRFLGMLASRAQEHGFNTELSGEDEGG